jgi:hypothetical protein
MVLLGNSDWLNTVHRMEQEMHTAILSRNILESSNPVQKHEDRITTLKWFIK